MPYTIVQLTTHFRDGDTMHRMTWPIQALAAQPDFRVIDIHYMHPAAYRLAFEADLLILSMMLDAELVPIIRWRKARGKPTVFEINNCPFDLHPLTPMFDLWSNPARQADCLYTLSLADLVQTTTEYLAQGFKSYCERVVVFPNQLAMTPASFPSKPEKPLVIGWAGSLSHVADLAHIAPAVSKWVMEHQDVVFAIMAHEPLSKLFNLPSEKKRYTPWGGMEAYEEFLKGVHIGLAPLCDTPFNRGRSDVKFIEYAAGGAVFVGQKIVTYTETVQDGKTGFLFKDTRELLRILDKLYKDRKLLESVCRAAFEYVRKNRTHEVHAPERARLYRELMERKPPEGGEKWNLHETSNFPRITLPQQPTGYIPIYITQEEERALQDLHSRRPGVPEQTIRMIEERFGEFHVTAYARAVTAAARGDLATAERHARHSTTLYPAALASLQLLATILASTRRMTEARDTLRYALQWHAACVPLYRQMIAFAEAESDWTTAIALTEEWEKHCNQDPSARMRRGLLLIRSGKSQEGIAMMEDAMSRFAKRIEYAHPPFAAEVVQILRAAEQFMAKEPKWPDLLLKAAEMFPYGVWLPTRAGQIYFERGEYPKGAAILKQARERLLTIEWQRSEGVNIPPDFRRLVEFHRMACEEMTHGAS